MIENDRNETARRDFNRIDKVMSQLQNNVSPAVS